MSKRIGVVVTIALIVHGGVGHWPEDLHDRAVEGAKNAVCTGRHLLEAGASALDAVCAATCVLEDDPIFNAGTGSVPNLSGFVEMDACVMDGADGQIGAVAAIQRVKNPILVARAVLERTDHVLLAADGALRFARSVGFKDFDPLTPERHEEWVERRAQAATLLSGDAPRTSQFLRAHPEYGIGTVGAVACDSQGMLCSATSTGGVTLKLPGRVGDTPIPGAGTYATRYAAASATGTGELVIRVLGSQRICAAVERGAKLADAINDCLNEIQRRFSSGDVGFIGVSNEGDVSAAHRTRHMPHAWFVGRGDIVGTIATA